MRRHSVFHAGRYVKVACYATAAFLLLHHAVLLHAQAGDPTGSEQTPPTAVLHTGTRLVVVDVIVQDAKSHPVHGLTAENFRLEESKSPQRLRNFEVHSTADAPKPGPPIPKLPAGTFTNYTPTPPGGTLNVLLIDAMNTPSKDQSYLRLQLADFVRKSPPGQSVAIFGLNSRLYMLQGFTSSPEVLRDAVDHKLIPRGSSLLEDPGGTNVETTPGSDLMADLGPGLDDVVANMKQFEAESQALQLQLRAQFTLDAMNALAHYLQNFPGRKNLIWFSGSFPINVLPDPGIQNGFSVMHLNEQEFRETTDLLTRAQVAVYPIDARGVISQPMFDAGNAGRKYAASPTALGKDITKNDLKQANENITMDQMAGQTGGHAYYGTNDLADAVKSAIDSGSNYYTLAYSPTNHDTHGEFREIHVSLVGAGVPAGLQLSYRRGYYSDNAAAAQIKQASATASTVDEDPQAKTADAYRRAAMSRGAPAPEDLLFQVSVTPVSDAPEPALAPGNQADPAKPVKGPFRRYAVNYAALPDGFTFTLQPNGHHVAVIAFKAYVFDPDGNLLVTENKGIRLDLPPAQYKQLLDAGIGMHLEVSAPAQTESFLRIAVEDVPSNKWGVVELSTARIAKLPPPPSPTQH